MFNKLIELSLHNFQNDHDIMIITTIFVLSSILIFGAITLHRPKLNNGE